MESEKKPIKTDKYDKLIEDIIGGRPPKYKEKTYIKLLFKIFEKGDDISTFCAQISVCRDTFYDWVSRHGPFRIAYQIAKEKARHWWECMGKKNVLNPKFNSTLWSMNMRNRHGYSEHRKVRVKGLNSDQTYAVQHKYIVDALGRGELTASEANMLAGLIAVGAKVHAIDKMQADVEMIKEKVGMTEK